MSNNFKHDFTEIYDILKGQPSKTPSVFTSFSFIHSKCNIVLLSVGLIAVLIFITMSALAITARVFWTKKETYRNQDVKASQPDEGQEFPFSSQADSQSTPCENQKEYFI